MCLSISNQNINANLRMLRSFKGLRLLFLPNIPYAVYSMGSVYSGVLFIKNTKPLKKGFHSLENKFLSKVAKGQEISEAFFSCLQFLEKN